MATRKIPSETEANKRRERRRQEVLDRNDDDDSSGGGSSSSSRSRRRREKKEVSREDLRRKAEKNVERLRKKREQLKTRSGSIRRKDLEKYRKLQDQIRTAQSQLNTDFQTEPVITKDATNPSQRSVQRAAERQAQKASVATGESVGVERTVTTTERVKPEVVTDAEIRGRRLVQRRNIVRDSARRFAEQERRQRQRRRYDRLSYNPELFVDLPRAQYIEEPAIDKVAASSYNPDSRVQQAVRGAASAPGQIVVGLAGGPLRAAGQAVGLESQEEKLGRDTFDPGDDRPRSDLTAVDKAFRTRTGGVSGVVSDPRVQTAAFTGAGIGLGLLGRGGAATAQGLDVAENVFSFGQGVASGNAAQAGGAVGEFALDAALPGSQRTRAGSVGDTVVVRSENGEFIEPGSSQQSLAGGSARPQSQDPVRVVYDKQLGRPTGFSPTSRIGKSLLDQQSSRFTTRTFKAESPGFTREEQRLIQESEEAGRVLSRSGRGVSPSTNRQLTGNIPSTTQGFNIDRAIASERRNKDRVNRRTSPDTSQRTLLEQLQLDSKRGQAQLVPPETRQRQRQRRFERLLISPDVTPSNLRPTTRQRTRTRRRTRQRQRQRTSARQVGPRTFGELLQQNQVQAQNQLLGQQQSRAQRTRARTRTLQAQAQALRQRQQTSQRTGQRQRTANRTRTRQRTRTRRRTRQGTRTGSPRQTGQRTGSQESNMFDIIIGGGQNQYQYQQQVSTDQVDDVIKRLVGQTPAASFKISQGGQIQNPAKFGLSGYKRSKTMPGFFVEPPSMRIDTLGEKQSLRRGRKR